MGEGQGRHVRDRGHLRLLPRRVHAVRRDAHSVTVPLSETAYKEGQGTLTLGVGRFR